jgi:hypothetical protein
VDVVVHNSALCESRNIGAGTLIGARSHVRPTASVGRDCSVGDDVFIDDNVVLGNGVTVETGARIGARAVIATHSTVGGDVAAGTVVVGNPARIVGYRGPAEPVSAARIASGPLAGARDSLHARGCKVVPFPTVIDPRGQLTVADLAADLPFAARRIFFVHDVPPGHVRGGHSHRACLQLLLAIQGSVSALIDDGSVRDEIILDHPGTGLLLPAGIWSTQYGFSENAVLVVFASRPYDPADYVRDYDQFRSEAARQRQ